MNISETEKILKKPVQSEEELSIQVEEAKKWLAVELEKLNTPDKIIEDNRHLLGGIIFATMTKDIKETPMGLARKYLEIEKLKLKKEE
jgi:hypothetical protein